MIPCRRECPWPMLLSSCRYSVNEWRTRSRRSDSSRRILVVVTWTTQYPSLIGQPMLGESCVLSAALIQVRIHIVQLSPVTTRVTNLDSFGKRQQAVWWPFGISGYLSRIKSAVSGNHLVDRSHVWYVDFELFHGPVISYRVIRISKAYDVLTCNQWECV
jgi:hypothetical protein